MEIDLAEILNIEPKFSGYENFGPEPNLGALLYKYYSEHFAHELAMELSQKYVNTLVVQYNEKE